MMDADPHGPRQQDRRLGFPLGGEAQACVHRSADRRERAGLAGGGAVGHGVDHAVALEIDGERRVGPAVEDRPLRLLPAAWIEAGRFF